MQVSSAGIEFLAACAIPRLCNIILLWVPQTCTNLAAYLLWSFYCHFYMWLYLKRKSWLH